MIKQLTLSVLLECAVYGEAPPMTPAIDESLNWLIMEGLVEYYSETDNGCNVTPKGEEWITRMQKVPVPGRPKSVFDIIRTKLRTAYSGCNA